MKRNLILCIASLIYFLLAYFLTNRFHLYEPRYLPLYDFENQIPFLPWTSWIYITDYFYLFTVVYVFRNRNLDNTFLGFGIFITIHALIFLFLPTAYPRSEWTLEPINILNSAMYFVRSVDSPANCFPSAHVGACFLGAFAVKKLDAKYFPFFLTWAILISLSTLTTKQHYSVDIIGGLLVGIISLRLGHKIHAKFFNS